MVGLDEAVHPSSEIRANVESEGRICEICSVCPKLEGARTDAGWTTVHKTPSGRNASVNFRGLLPEDVFLSYRWSDSDSDFSLRLHDSLSCVAMGPSRRRPVQPFRVSICAACYLNAIGQSRVTLSLREQP